MLKNSHIQVVLSQKFPELTSGMEARKTLAWLRAKVAGVAGALEEDWNRVRSRMEEANSNRRMMRLHPIVNDFWICKRANTAPRPADLLTFGVEGMGSQSWSTQRWQPPDDWTEWPTFGVESEDWLKDRNPKRAKQADRHPSISWAGDAACERSRAMQILTELASGAAGTPGITMYTQATAWLDTSLGRLGKIFDRSAVGDIHPRFLLQDLGDSVLPSVASFYADMVEISLQTLYGSAQGQGQAELVPQYTPGGQSFEWRDYFQALSQPASTEHALMAVQLAALTMRSEAIWDVLEMLRRGGIDDENVLDLATCVRRRWMLSLKALAWIEVSLQRPTKFELVTPADLMCFGIVALLPLYPRPIVAISHRSGDAKPLLKAGKVWGANEVMIDAMFRPVWQTNRAMIWSLFASTPVLCKVHSRTYDESEWCRRESEMFDHLGGSTDFMDGRLRFDIDLEEVRVLDRAAQSWSKTHRFLDAPEGIESPPMEMLKFDAWQGALIRAVAVARFVHRVIALADRPAGISACDIANEFLNRLHSDGSQGIPNSELLGVAAGWHVLSKSIREDAALLKLEGPLARACGDKDVRQAEEWFNRIPRIWPSVVPGDLNLCDMLAALDWRENLEPHLRQHNEGNWLEFQAGIIDLRNTNEAEWINDPGWTIARGLIFLRLPYPLNIRQRAGQDVDKWPYLRDVDIPIFTEHLPDQRLPQSEVFFSLGGPWPAVYHHAIADFVELAPHLAFACRESLKFGTDPVMVRADAGLSALSVGGGPSFEEWLQQKREAQSRDRGEGVDETDPKKNSGPQADSE